MNTYIKIIVQSAFIAIVAVYGVDYVSHLFFSDPMETVPYFLAKVVFYFVFAILFLTFIKLETRTFIKVAIAGVTVSLLWGFYYNILPVVMEEMFHIEFYPFGIELMGLTFLGMGLFGTGLAFGTVHAVGFFTGYYVSQFIMKKLNLV